MNLGVSDKYLNGLVEKARISGALGAKLTGGGLGGCMIALAGSMEQAREIAEGLMKAGANQTWYFSTVEGLNDIKHFGPKGRKVK